MINRKPGGLSQKWVKLCCLDASGLHSTTLEAWTVKWLYRPPTGSQTREKRGLASIYLTPL